MSQSDRLLRRLTAKAITFRDDKLNLQGIDSQIVAQLREQGYLERLEDVITPKALLQYFEKLPKLNCPEEVQKRVEEFCKHPPIWRQPGRSVKLKYGYGLAFCDLNTIFVAHGADRKTYWHELAHLLFGKIRSELALKLSKVAQAEYDVLNADQITGAINPRSGKREPLPKGRYICVNGRYCGIDHSGAAEEQQSDEIWASLFAEYCAGDPLVETVQQIMEEILADLKRNRTESD